MNHMKMEKLSVSKSGIFTIREYRLETVPDLIAFIRRLQAGPGEVREIITYVFSGEDPYGLDARSFSVEDFTEKEPQLQAYGTGLSLDVIMRREGAPVTVELTKGSDVVAVNALDQEIELSDLLGGDEAEENEAEDLPEALLKVRALLDQFWPDADDRCGDSRAADDLRGGCGKAAFHSWKLAVTAMLLSERKEYETISMDRVIRMCLLHGLENSPDDSTEGKKACMEKLPAGLLSLYEEMQEGQSPEARLYRTLDGTGRPGDVSFSADPQRKEDQRRIC